MNNDSLIYKTDNYSRALVLMSQVCESECPLFDSIYINTVNQDS